VVLRDQEWASEHVEGKLLEFNGVSVADGSGDGVRDSCGSMDEPVLWRNGRAVAQICLVREKFSGEDMAGGEFETKRLGIVRRAGECVYVVPGKIRKLSPE